MATLTKRPSGSNITKTADTDYRTLPVARCLFLVFFPLSLFAAGHDISSIRYGASYAPAGPAAVAYNGNHFLSVSATSSHIYGSLSAPAGGAVSPALVAIPYASSDVLQLTPAGSGYLAVWNQDATTPSLGLLSSGGVLERRVQLDGDKFVAPRLAFNGTNGAVVHQIGSPVNAIAVSVYDLTGRLVNRFTLPIAASESYAITSAGGDFIVVSAGSSGINLWRVATDGALLSTLQVQPPPALAYLSLYDVAVTAKSGRIAIAWEELQLLTMSSAVIQPDGSVMRAELPRGDLQAAGGVTILPIGIGFFIAWNVNGSATRKAFAVRLNDAGTLLDAQPANLGTAPFIAAASSGNVIQLMLSTAPSLPPTLFVDVDANAISPRTPISAALTPVRQASPVVAGNGAAFTAAWLESSANSQSAVVGRVTTTGEALDGPGITLGSQTAPPAIAHGPSTELVVWSANGNLVASRLSRSGALFDTPPIVIAPLSSPFSAFCAAAWNGSRFFVVWAEGFELFGSFVGADGIATPRRPLGIETLPLQAPPSELDLAWDGRQFILVFAQTERPANGCSVEGCPSSPLDLVRLMRVSADGIAIDAKGLRIPGVHLHAHVASRGGESLIALDGDSLTSAMIVRDESGVLQFGPEIPLFRWIGPWIRSDVTWTGSLYVVAWRYGLPQTEMGWIGVSRISESGVPFGSLFTRTGSPAESGPPSVAANDAVDVAVVISEIAPPSYAARARLYLLPELAPMPAAPRAPQSVVTYSTGTKTVIVWQSDGPQDGFFIEISTDFGESWHPRATTNDVRSVTLVGSPGATRFRVNAFSSGGLSEPVVATAGRIARHRAERR